MAMKGSLPYPIQANANSSLAYRLAAHVGDETGRSNYRRAVGGVSRGQQLRGASRVGRTGLSARPDLTTDVTHLQK